MNEKQKFNTLSPFLMSSVPKSGTHLLHQILTGIPSIEMDITNAEKKFFFDVVKAKEQYFTDLYHDHSERLGLLKNNEFGLGHVRCTAQYASILEKLNMKHIFLHRDPRDVLVSLSYFVKDKWSEHPLFEMFQSPALTSKQRQLILINGTPKWPDFSTYMSGFYEWLNNNRTFHVSYEELTGSEESQRKTLNKLVRYIWNGHEVPCSFDVMVSHMINNIDANRSATFRSGKIGEWEKEFDEDIKEAFKKNAGHLLVRFGYVQDNNW